MTRREVWDMVQRTAASVYEPAEARAVTALICEMRLGLRFTDVIVEPGAPYPDCPDLERIAAELRDLRPAQYIAGCTLFCNRRFTVREGVLIPRPETEEIVRYIASHHGGTDGLHVLDIGTGSGCIAVSLADLLPGAHVTGIDISDTALATARENAEANGDKVRLLRCDILTETPDGTFDLIISNPPYVTQREKEQMRPNVLKHEPHRALFVPDDDPLLFYRAIARKGKTLLRPGGMLYFEINELFGAQTAALLEGEGYVDVRVGDDLFGKPRMTEARWK